MPLFKKAFQQFSNTLPITLLQKASPINVYLPYHHLVSDDQVPHIAHLYPYKNSIQFEEDLDYLLRYFKPVTLQEVISTMKGGNPLPKNPFLLTFDDGLKEIYTVVAPILERKGIPAVFFLNNDFIDNKQLFYRFKISLLIHELLKHPDQINLQKIYARAMSATNLNVSSLTQCLIKIRQDQEETLDSIASEIGFSFANYLKDHQPFLSSEQIQSLVKRGFSIGGHSLNHPYYPLLTEPEQYRQTTESVSDICSRFGVGEKVFAFPHTDTELNVPLMERLSKTDIDLFFGIQNQKKEGHFRMLHRFNAERPSMPLRKQIKTVMVYNTLLEITGKNRVNRTR